MMGTYRKEWPCCGDVTETEAWEPEECPFCRSTSSVREEKMPELPKALVKIDQNEDGNWGEIQSDAWDSEYPHEFDIDAPLFTADQMRDYARAAIAADRRARQREIEAHMARCDEMRDALFKCKQELEGNRAATKAAAPDDAPRVEIARGRVWIVKGSQSFMLAYEPDAGDDPAEMQAYADQLRAVIPGFTPGVKVAPAEDAREEVPPLPDPVGLSELAYAQKTPESWDHDYRSTWQKLQVALANNRQWRAYAKQLREQLARRASSVPAIPGTPFRTEELKPCECPPAKRAKCDYCAGYGLRPLPAAPSHPLEAKAGEDA